MEFVDQRGDFSGGSCGSDERFAWHELGHYVGYAYLERLSDVQDVELFALDNPAALGVVRPMPGTMMTEADDALIAIVGPIMESFYESDETVAGLERALGASADGDLIRLIEYGYMKPGPDGTPTFTERGEDLIEAGLEVASKGMGFVKAMAPLLVELGYVDGETLAGMVGVYRDATGESLRAT